MTFAAQRGSNGSTNNDVINRHNVHKCPIAAGGVQRLGIRLGEQPGSAR
jgi:hypothetical protein